jgi:rRNA pseudouridine-1189 N-methylase Emg1 (Nep1/Mra1 family)
VRRNFLALLDNARKELLHRAATVKNSKEFARHQTVSLNELVEDKNKRTFLLREKQKQIFIEGDFYL